MPILKRLLLLVLIVAMVGFGGCALFGAVGALISLGGDEDGFRLMFFGSALGGALIAFGCFKACQALVRHRPPRKQ